MNSNLNNFMHFQTPEQVHLVNSIQRKQLYKALKFYNGKEIWRSSFIDVEVKETTNAFSDIDAFPVIKKDIVIII